MRKTRSVLSSVLALVAASCGSSSSQSPGNGTPTPAAMGSCADSQLSFLFPTLYSAFDGMHNFQIPEAVEGFDSPTTGKAIAWSASDPSMVDLSPGWADKNGVTGVLIQTRKAGTVNIIASVGNLCGSAALTIAAADPNDWMIGSARYNNGMTLTRGGPGGGLRPTDGGIEAACTSCHGDTATNGPYKTVSHTPEQIGGFPDDALVNIFKNGMFPSPDDFDTNVMGLTLQAWSRFHHWAVTDEQTKGLVVYLRSLTPSAQTGASNFGGGMFGDGGFRRRGDGGRGPGGGGQPPPGDQPDAAMP